MEKNIPARTDSTVPTQKVTKSEAYASPMLYPRQKLKHDHIVCIIFQLNLVLLKERLNSHVQSIIIMEDQKPPAINHNACPIYELHHHLEGKHYTKQEKFEFTLFLKVLLRCLEKSQQVFMLQQARLVVLTCIRGCKMGDSSFYPLIEAIELRLKKLVGHIIWQQAKLYTRFYLQRQRELASRCRPKSPPPVARYTAQI
jgi:hypothetical protein